MGEATALLKQMGKAEDVIVNCTPFDIGRCRTAKLVVPNVCISRKQCQLVFNNDCTWVVEDLSSSGTFVNEELVGKGNSVIIKNNDMLRLGPEEFNYVWQFRTNMAVLVDNAYYDVDRQSQIIVDICAEKHILRRKISHTQELFQQMKVEKEMLQEQCWHKVKALNDRLLQEELENKSSEMREVIENQVEEGKKKIREEMEEKLNQLQEKIIENNKMENQFRSEIQKLQERLMTEQRKWEERIMEERNKLEQKINEQNEKLAMEKLKAKETFMIREQQLEDKLKKEEEEKQALSVKLNEMEETKKILLNKLKESDELHLTVKARLEEEMQKELRKREEDMKALLQEQILAGKNSLQNEKVETHENEEMENEELNKFDQGKTTLTQTEFRQKLLEREAHRVESNVLENIADIMETELQCSVCSELFITAIILNCTHTFCKYCIDLWRKKKNNCPICRKKITSEVRSIAMDNYIERMVEKLSEEMKSRRKAVITERYNAVSDKKRKSLTLAERSAGSQTPTVSRSRFPSTSGSRSYNRRLAARVSESSR